MFLHASECEIRLLANGFKVSSSQFLQSGVRGEVQNLLDYMMSHQNDNDTTKSTYVQYLQVHFQTGSRFELNAGLRVQCSSAHRVFFGSRPDFAWIFSIEDSSDSDSELG
jgi:hypothetical protein